MKKVKKKRKPKIKVGEVKLLKCSNCGGEFFMVITTKGKSLCLGCSNG